ncbi:MAG: thioredoxin [Rhodocyclaceae bacterium]|nr:thioredoxin [Rhodocyclaceae bacterium]
MSDPVHVVCPHCHTTNRVPQERLADGGTCGRCKERLFPGTAVELDQASFDRHVGHSDIPLVVDFWAPWCGPCRSMAPHFAEAARRLSPHYRLAKVNTEEEQQLAARYDIRSIPTLAVFRNGAEVARTSGAMPAEALMAWVRQNSPA